MKSNKIFLILAFIGVYLLSTGISFASFNFFRKPSFKQKAVSPIVSEGDWLLDVSGPKTEECPISGKMFTVNEKDAWEEKRPLTVMIENHEEARPQSGLSQADVIYEAVAEGSITRFSIIFYCSAVAKESIVGPVRSARTYFLDLISEYGETPLYAHVGGAHCDRNSGTGCLNGAKADALGQISDYGWEGENDLNQFSIGYPTFWRDYERLGHTVATEHTMYSTTQKLWAVGEKRGWTNEDPEGTDWQTNFTKWAFKDDAGDSDRGSKNKIEYGFWEEYGDYKVAWEYDRENNEYKRSNGGKPHTDLNNEQQLTAKNVIVQFARESSANDGYPGNIHLLYDVVGEGEGLLFQDGKAHEITWSKSSRTARTQFYLEGGKEAKFVRGRAWISVVPLDVEVDY